MLLITVLNKRVVLLMMSGKLGLWLRSSRKGVLVVGGGDGGVCVCVCMCPCTCTTERAVEREREGEGGGQREGGQPDSQQWEIINYLNFTSLPHFLACPSKISNLFARDEMDEITQGLVSVMKRELPRHPPTFDNLYEYFITRSRKNLHVVLCFSPVSLRSLCRQNQASNRRLSLNSCLVRNKPFFHETKMNSSVIPCSLHSNLITSVSHLRIYELFEAILYSLPVHKLTRDIYYLNHEEFNDASSPIYISSMDITSRLFLVDFRTLSMSSSPCLPVWQLFVPCGSLNFS